MYILQKRIEEEGKVLNDDVLRVDMFINHQIDVALLNELGKEYKRRFEGYEITKILTIESSGIAIACITAQYFSVPVVFAKKHESRNMDSSVYQSEVYSFTKEKFYNIRVSKEFILPSDKILIIDDFLANGRAILGLMDIIEQAGASLTGVGVVIEKGFQDGGKKLREAGVKLESLAIIDSMENGNLKFR